ncbi:MAG: GldG family protein [Acidobacteria bacterium]|nr:GldG family protein [Acidobacteriota bacterium]
MANILKSRQAKYGAYAGAYIVVILAVLVAVNFLANRYSKAYDSTANKQFSLSDQTDKVVKNLKNDVQITYFDDTSRFPQARDLLDRYSALSPKLSVRYVDPVKKPQQAKADGYRRDLTILISSNGRQEEAKSLTEEEVTGALIRSQKTGQRNVCFVNAAGEKSIDDEAAGGFSMMKQLLERDNYKTRTVNLRPGAPEAGKTVAIGQAPVEGPVQVPSDCLALVVGGPQLDYPQPVVDALQKYVEGGGHAMFMLDTPMKLGRDNAAGENAALLKVLADWGVTANKDLVLDLSGIGGMFGAGPEIPIILQYESDPITQPLQRVPTAFPLTRSLEVKSPAKGTAEKLIATTEDSVAVDKIGAGGQVDPKTGKKGPLILAAKGTTGGSPAGRWVVTGTSGWAENRALGSRTLGNRDLFMNMINWLTADEDLISIRPKAAEDRPLTMTAQKLNTVFFLSVIIFPLGIVGLGLATWWKRR